MGPLLEQPSESVLPGIADQAVIASQRPFDCGTCWQGRQASRLGFGVPLRERPLQERDIPPSLAWAAASSVIPPAPAAVRVTLAHELVFWFAQVVLDASGCGVAGDRHAVARRVDPERVLK